MDGLLPPVAATFWPDRRIARATADHSPNMKIRSAGHRILKQHDPDGYGTFLRLIRAVQSAQRQV
jgi:hypothetical protein